MKYIKKFESYNSEYRFYYSCVAPDSLDELESIIDHMGKYDTEVKLDEFIKYVKFDDIQEILPTYDTFKQLKNDYHVRYYIGDFYYDSDGEFNKEYAIENDEEYNTSDYGVEIEYAVIVWSAIEFVFKKTK